MKFKPFRNEIYAPNNEITGDYDKSLAAKCTNGTFVGYMEDDILAYKGIPFAKSPVGKLRWKRPQPVEASDKVYEAFHSGKNSIQPPSVFGGDISYEVGEDCLYLNIYNNTSDKTEKKAVMVWIHGGEFNSGGNSKGTYDGYNFVSANSDIILVVINYRLGMMGFFDATGIEGGESYPDCNLGTYDQVEAIKWVKENIAAFGGDPERITVFGESAGAASTSTLCVMKEAKGLFKRAIIQSGGVDQFIYKEDAIPIAKNIAEAFNLKTMDDLLELTEDQLIEYWNTAQREGSNYLVMDGQLFDKEPFDLWDEGASTDIEIMQGYMADEWRCFSTVFQPRKLYNAVGQFMQDYFYELGNEDYKQAYKEYKEHIAKTADPDWPGEEFMSDYYFQKGPRHQASAHVKNGGRGYCFIFDIQCEVPGLKACHGVDVGYTMGNFDGGFSSDTPENREMSLKLQKMWTNFAKTGDPSTEDLKWPEYDLETRATMRIGADTHVENDPRSKRRELTERMGKGCKEYNHFKTVEYMQVKTLERHPELKQ